MFHKKTGTLTVTISLLWILFLSSCTSLPSLLEQEQIDPAVTMARFQADQEKRHTQLRQWRASGVLEITTEYGKKRFRAKMQGKGALQAKVSIFGPMRQIIGVLFANPEIIYLVDPAEQKIMEVPATAEGLASLVGIDLKPSILFMAITTLADKLVQQDPTNHHTWLTESSERLVLEPETGLIQERFGETNTGEAYHITYRWEKPLVAERETAALPPPAHDTHPQHGTIESARAKMAETLLHGTIEPTKPMVGRKDSIPLHDAMVSVGPTTEKITLYGMMKHAEPATRGTPQRHSTLADLEKKSPAIQGKQGTRAESDVLRMPSQVQVILESGENQVKFTARRWKTPVRPFVADWFSVFVLAPGFPIVQPSFTP